MELKPWMCGHPDNSTNGKQRISRSTGQPCRKARLVGATACKNHGGASQGTRHYQYKDGRYSRADHTGLFAQRYEEAQRDPDLLSLRDEIHLVDVRLGHLVAGLTEDLFTDRRQWRQILDLIDRREKIVASERKRMVEMQQVITLDRLAVLAQGIASVIQSHVKDPTALANISKDLGTLLDQVAFNPGHVH